MPKPPGTYRRVRQMDSIRARSRASKATVAIARKESRLEFSRAVERVSIEELESWRRFVVDLRGRIERGETMSADDRKRRYLGEIIGEIRTMFEKVQDYRQVEAALQAPVRPVIRTPSAGTTALPTIIALCALLEALVRVVRRRKKGLDSTRAARR